jgi:tRNA nucleotidyltransferase (CCA-adding enzyme)
MNIFIPDDVKVIMNRLNEYGFKSYVVGGAIRNSLLNIPVKDWDICTNAKPNEMLSVFKNFYTIETGIKHGTLTVVLNNINYEVTTFRVDGDYSDNRHPDSVEFVDDIVMDLSRRDFTINAMAYNETEGLIDPFGGQSHIIFKDIQCVGNPDDRFQEDALRMLRAVRFASQLDFDIQLREIVSIKNNSNLIKNISNERIRDELVKILMSNDPSWGIGVLRNYGLMNLIIPKLEICFKCPQNNPFHIYDVGTHILTTLIDSPKDLNIRLALMLHDIGKPIAKIIDESGIDHFYEHEKVSANLAWDWMREYKFDNQTVDEVFELILWHDYFIDPSKRGVKKLLNNIGVDKTLKLLDIRVQDIKAQSVEFLKPRLEKIEKIRKEINEIVFKQEAFQIKDLKINGDDLIELGFKPSKELGECLNLLLDMVIENPEFNNKEKLLELAKDNLWELQR